MHRRSLAVAALVLAACASSKAASTSGASTTAAAAVEPAAPRATRSSTIITEAEIASATGITNAFDLVNRLRPSFFRITDRKSMGTTSSAPLVRLNGTLMGEATELKGIVLSDVQEIRYFSVVEAESRWSADRGRPVILVTTKKLRK